jgi:fermentation-respiration switch protein FrsA (DUF1100 family)
MSDAIAEAAAYFRRAPERLNCTLHGRALAWELAAARADLSGARDRIAALLRDLDQVRSDLAVERAMRREGGP